MFLARVTLAGKGPDLPLPPRSGPLASTPAHATQLHPSDMNAI